MFPSAVRPFEHVVVVHGRMVWLRLIVDHVTPHLEEVRHGAEETLHVPHERLLPPEAAA